MDSESKRYFIFDPEHQKAHEDEIYFRYWFFFAAFFYLTLGALIYIARYFF